MEELDRIIEYGDSLPKQDATIGNKKGNIWIDDHGNVRTRKTEVSWIKCSKSTEWIFQRLLAELDELFEDSLHSLEPIQFGVYYVDSHYDWHIDGDTKAGKDRALAAVLQLSHPEEHTGGDLEILVSEDNVWKVPREKGKLVVIGRGVLHRVTKVTSGIRKTLTVWGRKE